jgi:hypothetical protein
MNLNPLRHIHGLRALYRSLRDLVEQQSTIAKREAIARLLTQDRYSDESRLIRCGNKIYSQHHEDGMISEIFHRIGCRSRYFIEFGVGDGLENNTLALLMQDWKGAWIEGSRESCQKIQSGFNNTIESGQLTVQEGFITRDNIDDLIKAARPPQEVDLLSIDIDGNDFHVWERVECVQPRVVVIEYNPKFQPPIEYCMQYNPSHIWDLSDHCGASLSFLERRFRERGYRLIGCDLTGTNAFFIQADLAQRCFQGPFTAEFHYEPARFELRSVPSGHPASYRTLETRVKLGKAPEVALSGARPHACDS